MGSFYDKEIKIYTYQEYKNERKITKEHYVLFETDKPILVDIQPYSSERAKKDYGYSIVTTKRMFSDVIPEIDESSIIVYRNQQYSIQGKPLNWDDDYLITMLLETKVNLDE